MQSPTEDPSFKAFLEKLQEQNNQAFATQLGQLKTEREIAGEDNDKRETQLKETNENLKGVEEIITSIGSSLSEGLSNVSDDIIEVQDLLDTVNTSLTEIDGTLKETNTSLTEIDSNLKETKESFKAEMLPALSDIKEALTGIKTAIEKVGYDVGTDIDKGHLSGLIGALNVNLSLTQNEQIKELSLIRKLAEGSVEYDKEAAQYRNTSGRDVESKVSGKTSKSGGFIDFETARDTLSGQGDRAKKENRLNLITDVTTTRSRSNSNYNSPGKLTAKSLGANSDSSAPEDLKEKESVVIPGISPPVKRARRERGSAPEVTPRNKKEEEDEKPFRLGNFSDFLKGAKDSFGDIKTFFSGSVKAKKDEEVDGVTPGTTMSGESGSLVEASIGPMGTKSDIEASKEQLQITKDSLVELKAIREALSPKTKETIPVSPGSKEAEIEKKHGKTDKVVEKIGSAVSRGAGAAGSFLGGIGSKASKSIGMGSAPAVAPIPAAVPGALTSFGTVGAAAAARRAAAEGAPVSAPSAAAPEESSLLGDVASTATDLVTSRGTLGKVAKFGGKFAKVGGAALAIGAGAYTAYTGYTAAEDSKQEKLAEVQANFDSGQLSSEDAASQRKKIGNSATVEKSEAVGEGTGMAVGGIAGMQAGAAIGGTIGLAFGGVGAVPGAVIGGALGGAAGAFAGSKVGKVAGEYGGKAINAVSNFGSSVSDFFSSNKDKSTAVAGKQSDNNIVAGTKSESFTKIAGERVVPDQPLSDKQMAVIEMSKGMGNKYSPEVEAQYAKQKESTVVSASSSPSSGSTVAETSTENADMTREAAAKGGSNNTVVSNNVSSNSTNSFVPMKVTPRGEQGSSLNRYMDRTAVY